MSRNKLKALDSHSPQRKFAPAERQCAVFGRLPAFEIRLVTPHLVTRLTVTSVLFRLKVLVCKQSDPWSMTWLLEGHTHTT